MRVREVLSGLELAGFGAHARSAGFRDRLERTRRLLGDALSSHAAHISFSGGKDSTVCLYLAREVEPEIPVAHFDSGGEHPASARHIREVGEELGAEVHTFYPRLSYPDILRKAYGGGIHVSSSELMRLIIDEPAARAARAFGSDSYVIGLRREESPGRDWSARTHGPVFKPKEGLTRIAPLLDWTWKDVWAATVLFELPVHPAYAERFEGESLERMRVGVVTDLASGHTAATLSRLHHHDPVAYAELKAQTPEAPWPI